MLLSSSYCNVFLITIKWNLVQLVLKCCREQLELLIQLQKGGGNQRDSSLSKILHDDDEDVQPLTKNSLENNNS